MSWRCCLAAWFSCEPRNPLGGSLTCTMHTTTTRTHLRGGRVASALGNRRGAQEARRSQHAAGGRAMRARRRHAHLRPPPACSVLSERARAVDMCRTAVSTLDALLLRTRGLTIDAYVIHRGSPMGVSPRLCRLMALGMG